jgi:hypothetical protein
MNAEFSMGALPPPVISRAPSNTVTLVFAVPCVSAGEEHAAMTHATGTMSRHHGVLFTRGIAASSQNLTRVTESSVAGLPPPYS